MSNEPQTETSLEAQPQETLEMARLRQEKALTEFAGSPFASGAAAAHFMKIAEIFSRSIFVPDVFRNKPGDCLIAIDLARSMDEPPLRVMQNTYVVGGRPAFYTQFMIARANRLAGYQSSIKWRVERLQPATLAARCKERRDGPEIAYQLPNLRVEAYATDRHGEEISAAIESSMALAEGWTTNPKYKSMAEHMLKWRAATFLIRLYNPEVMNGFPTAEELQDISAAAPEPFLVGSGQSKTAALVARITEPQRAAEEEPQPEAPDEVPVIERESHEAAEQHLREMQLGAQPYLTPAELDAWARECWAVGLTGGAFEQAVEDETGTDQAGNDPDPLSWSLTRPQAAAILEKARTK